MRYTDGEWFEHPKARKFQPTRMKSDVLIEEKLDGECLFLWKGHAYGRAASVVTDRRENKWATLPSQLQRLARSTPVEGEIYVPGGTSSEVKTALVRDPGRVRFVAFRVVDARIMPHQHRKWLREMGFQVPRLVHEFECEGVRVGPRAYYFASELQTELESLARANGLEGWMLKERSDKNLWWKFKLEDTLDLVVVGLKPGVGKFEGMVGSLYCSGYCHERGEWVEVASISGMNDATRRAITEKDVGRAVEVSFKGWAAKGRLRHPQFERWRDDKPAVECVLPLTVDRRK